MAQYRSIRLSNRNEGGARATLQFNTQPNRPA
jgi:hypothetical protein